MPQQRPYSQASLGWIDFLEKCVKRAGELSPQAAAAMLRTYVTSVCGVSDPITVESMATALDLKILNRTGKSLDQGNAVLRRRPQGLLWPAPGVIEIGPGTAPRHRMQRDFLVAHELGHWVLDSLLINPCIAERCDLKEWASPSAQETFASLFAQCLIEPLIPEFDRELHEIERQMTISELKQAELWRAEGGPNLTVYHLVAIARTKRLSLRHVISHLRGTSLLVKAQTGIVVYRQMTNQFTLRDTGIRIWQAALPPWGFMPKNQRAWRHGMVSMLDICLTGKHFRTVFHTERQLHVRENVATSGCVRKYVEVTLSDIRCATTPIDVSGEGRFLVAMFAWPRPIDWQKGASSGATPPS